MLFSIDCSVQRLTKYELSEKAWSTLFVKANTYISFFFFFFSFFINYIIK